MVKPVGARCNLECGYCYYHTPGYTDRSCGESEGGVGAEADSYGSMVARTDSGDSCGVFAGAGTAAQPPGWRMSREVLEEFIRQYIEASAGPAVYFTWHGGEPTLAGLDFYRTAVALQNKHTPANRHCVNNLQTNGILLDDEWCAFLSKEQFDVGLSLDGVQWAHDAYRKDRAGNGSYAAAAAAVHRLKSHGVRPDLLCTVTPQTASEPLSVYRVLRDFDTGWVQFIPVVRRGAGGLPAQDCVSADEYGAFLCEIFDEWSLNDLGKIDVQIFAETAHILAGGNAGLCWMAPVCGKALIVERDGSVYSCDHYAIPEYRLGDIMTSRLRDLADLPFQRRFGDSKREALPAQCRACRWLAACNGGCPKDRFARTENVEPGLNYLCSGLQRFFSHAEKPLKQIAAYSRSGYSPETIMQKMREEERAMWKGVGRNDPCPCGSGRKAKNCCLTANKK